MSKTINPNTYLRIVSNTNCNFNCFFCHHEGEINYSKTLPSNIILDTINSKPYLNKIKITGGEPSLRKDLSDLIREIRKISDAELSLTTNGYLLKENVKKLYESGLQRISVSLHSLNKKKFKELTGVNGLTKVLRGLDEAKKYYDNIKINTVFNSENICELNDFIEYAKKNDFSIKALCLMPVDNSIKDKSIKKEDLFDILKFKSEEIIEKRDRYIFVIDSVKVELKKTILYESCKVCDFLKKCEEGEYATRLTVEGNLKSCLYKDEI